MYFSKRILEQRIISERRTTAVNAFGNVRRFGPTLTRPEKIVLLSYPTNELPISKAVPKSCEQKY